MSSETAQILVVDDVLDNLSLLQTFLQAEGYTVEMASDGALAWDKMKAAPPDLVLLDIMMPNMDGYELTRKIRRDDQLRSIPVVLITAHVEACRIKGLAVGATDFIRKPIDFDDLTIRVKAILEHSASVQRSQDFHFTSINPI
ncbi:MAG TPA: response regulator [Crinalium sp.]|jgi:CheY-like chemotaxis protein